MVKQALRSARRQVWRHWPQPHLFIFGGRTHYWAGIGRELYEREPVFRAVVQECEQLLPTLGGSSLLTHFEGLPDPAFLTDETRMQQLVPVLQLALLELWRANGVEPHATLGISSGEAAAVYAAGGLSKADALRVILSGARICQVEPKTYGALYAVASYEQLQPLCAQCPVGLFITTVLEPGLCNLFCALADLATAEQYLRAQGISCRRIKCDPIWPYHTPLLSRHEALLREPLQDICPRPLTKPCYLTTLGRMVPPGTVLEPDYWLLPPRQPVLLHTTLQAAVQQGYRVLTPLGSAPFPYFSRTAQKNLFHAARMLVPMLPGVPEGEAFAARRRELDDFGLVRAIKRRQVA